MLNKLLVAIDESAASDWALETAPNSPGALNAELILVHVLDIYASSSPVSPFTLVDNCLSNLDEKAQKDYESKMTEYASRYDALLEEKQAKAKAAGVTAQSMQPYGRPSPVICQAASVITSSITPSALSRSFTLTIKASLLLASSLRNSLWLEWLNPRRSSCSTEFWSL